MELKAFMKPRPLARATGISESFIRRGLRDGTIPHIRAGRDYLIAVQPFMEMLEKQSREASA